jgi:stage II sporulation protein P
MGTKRMFTAKPFLVAYVIAVGFTLGLLLNRTPTEEAVAAVALAEVRQHGANASAHPREEPPIWMQLFRPTQPTARWMMRMGLPILTLVDGTAAEEENRGRSLLVYWAGRAGEQPQTLFQTVLPFLRSNGEVVQLDEPVPVEPTPGGAVQPPLVDQGKGPGSPSENGPQGDRSPPKETPVANGLPLIGIYHTHDWESWISEYPLLSIQRQQDLDRVASYDHKKKTIVNIGELLAHRLRDLGVSTAHSNQRHQRDTYDYAYRMSRTTAKEILAKYPSIKILLDLHRDGAYGANTTTTVKGKKAAQIRCIIGAQPDERWQQNKAFCDQLIERLEQKHPGLTLPTRIQGVAFDYFYNQDLTPGAVLLEIGSAMNRYDEAERSARYLAEILAEMVRDGGY